MTTILFLERHTQFVRVHMQNAKTIFLDNNIPKLDEPSSMLLQKKEDYMTSDDLYDANRKAIAWLKEWAGKRIVDEKSFKDLFVYKDLSLWWFVDFWLFYHELHPMTMKEALQSLFVIDTIVKKENPSRILRIDDGSLFSRTLAQYCKAKKIECIDVAHEKAPILSRMRPSILEWLKYKKFFARGLASRILGNTHVPANPEVMLVGLTSQWVEQTDHITGAKRKIDAMLQPIIDELQKRKIPFINVDADFTPTTGLRQLQERKEFAVPAEQYITMDIRKTAMREGALLKQKYAQVRDTIAASLLYDGVDLWPLFKNRFEFMFDKRIPEVIMWIETYLKIIKTHNPKSILVIDENDLPGRAALAAGRLAGKKVVALQHGTLSEFCFDYMHLKGEIAEDLSVSTPFCPVGQKMAVYGEHAKTVLVEHGNFPSTALVQTGQPRYDVIQKLKRELNRGDVCKEFGLDPTKKIILYATQPSKDSLLLTEKVFSSMKRVGMESVQVIIKPHPRETDFEKYSKIASQKCIKATIINRDLFKLLFICDLVVHRDSAVGLEAMLFSRPVLSVFIFSKDIPEVNQFMTSGCRVATNDEELDEQLRDALTADNKSIIAAQTEFIKKETFNHDGLATKRVVDLLLD